MTAGDVSWFAVHTKPRAEELAEKFLKFQGFTVFYPRISKKISHARKIIDVMRPYFPRYIFVGLDERKPFSHVNNSIGVSTIVYSGDYPLEIPVQIMEALMSRSKDGLMPEVIGDVMKPGQRRRITSGAFKDFIAEIQRVDRSNKISVSIEGSGHCLQASIGRSQLGDIVHPTVR